MDKEPLDWSADGRFVIFRAPDPKTGDDLWMLPMEGDRTPRPLVQTPAGETRAQLSADRRWLAYESDESGVAQVYVQSFPPSGAKWQVSSDGGSQPRWRGDGRELFYLSADHKLMAVDVKPGSTFEIGTHKELFLVNVFGVDRNDYAVTADGERFLINSVVEQTGTAITVVTNWLAALKSRD